MCISSLLQRTLYFHIFAVIHADNDITYSESAINHGLSGTALHHHAIHTDILDSRKYLAYINLRRVLNTNWVRHGDKSIAVVVDVVVHLS